jgi:acetylornithine/LysW-gamma-L-lysine aminotransferase
LIQLRAALAETPVVREVRGIGMMIGIDLRQKPGPYLKKLMDEHGLLALPAGSSVLRLLPPLIAGEAEIDEAVQAIAAALA